MPDPEEMERLRALEARIAKLRKDREPAPAREDGHTMGQVAWRMVTELVAGLLVGFGIGLGLDVLLGTRPWLLVLFTLLGFWAGIRTMMRTAQELQRRNMDAAATPAGDRGERDRG
jgi:ATP synthase protein I